MWPKQWFISVGSPAAKSRVSHFPSMLATPSNSVKSQAVTPEPVFPCAAVSFVLDSQSRGKCETRRNRIRPVSV
jgi:hypothetical protein